MLKARREKWKMGAYRPLNRVVPLHFRLRRPRNYSGTTSVEHSTTSGAATLGINTRWATTSLLVSPLNQPESAADHFFMLSAYPIPTPACSLGKGWSPAWRLLSGSVGTSNTGVLQGASRVPKPCLLYGQRMIWKEHSGHRGMVRWE